MKSIKRKLLSLLLAMAMVLTLAPTALAEGYQVTITQSAPEGVTTDSNGKYPAATTVTLTASATEGDAAASGTLTYSWTVDGTTQTNNNTNTTTVSATDKDITVSCTISSGTQGDDGYKSGTASVTVKFAAAPVTPPVTSTAAKLLINNAGGKTVKIAANANSPSETVTATLANSSNSPVDGEMTISPATGTVSKAVFGSDGHTINITRVGTSAGTDTFTIKGTGANESLTATLTVNVEATTSSTLPTISIVNGSGTNTLAVGNSLIAWISSVSPVVNDNQYDKIDWSSNNPSVLSITTGSTTKPTQVTFNGLANGSATVTVQYKSGSTVVAQGSTTIQVGSTGAYLTGTPASGSTVALDNWYSYDNSVRYHYFSVTPGISGVTAAQLENQYTVSYAWYLGNSINSQRNLLSNASSSSYTLYSNNQYLYYNNNGYTNNVLTCEATFRLRGSLTTAYTATAYWYIGDNYYNGNVFASATIYRSSGSYALGELDDAGKSSIVSQLDSYFYNYNTALYQYGYGLAYVQFVNTTDSTTGSSLNATVGTSYYVNNRSAAGSFALSSVLLYPGNTTGTATFRIRAYYYTSSAYNTTSYVEGAITFAITGSTYTGDITYSGSIGSDVAFALKDFEDYYYKKTSGTLSYVTFTLPSGGALYSDSGRLSASNACYASPTWNQTDLAGVYFSPTGTTATRANTVTVNFTAYGNRSTTTGTVVITYLAGSAGDITYNIYTSGTLNPNDFTNAYRQVVGSTAPTGLTIQFQSVPTYGSLSYKDSSRSNSTVVGLRSTNIRSYRFTTLSTGTNQLGDVTYTASGNRTDTIEYTAYVNNTPQFTGKVIFNGSNASAANMQVGITCTSSQGVAFSYAEFARANAAVIAMTSYIHFVTMPSNGTLTYNGVAMTTSGSNIMPTMLDSVVYRPNAGFNNSTDRVNFLCYDTNGNSIGGGQVSIVVTGNGSSAASVGQFKDVSSSAWYRNDLITLMNAGIIKGRGDGKFDPTAELTYGEALKIFLLAAGYPAQAETTGKNWAINYKTVAVNNQWIDNSVDLSAKISRNAMAALTAKALGVSPISTVPPVWTDGTSDGYSNALYYTNPQILIGNGDGTFKGTSTLLRQEICAIAARVLSYKNNQLSTDKPNWLS